MKEYSKIKRELKARGFEATRTIQSENKDWFWYEKKYCFLKSNGLNQPESGGVITLRARNKKEWQEIAKVNGFDELIPKKCDDFIKICEL